MEKVRKNGKKPQDAQHFKIAPSVLSADFTKLGKQLKAIEKAGADYVHYDVMDGHFVQEITYGEGILKQMKKATKLPLDVHLMVSNPEKQILLFAEAGADLITFHLEATDCAEELIDLIHSYRIPAAVSVKPGTPVETVFPFLEKVEMVLIMTVEPGFGGQAFIPESEERIRTLRAEIEQRGLRTDIEVDGGINFDTVIMAKNAGANVFVSGSTVFRGNIAKNMKALRAKLN